MRYFLLPILLTVFISSAFSQRKINFKKPISPFNAGILVGINASQVDGDDQFGYDKIGFSGGL